MSDICYECRVGNHAVCDRPGICKCAVCDKPAATEQRHGAGSGEATFCKNCGKPIVEDTSGRGWRHGETGPYLCSETRATPRMVATIRDRLCKPFKQKYPLMNTHLKAGKEPR